MATNNTDLSSASIGREQGGGLLEAMLIDRRTLSQLARTQATAGLDKAASISMKRA